MELEEYDRQHSAKLVVDGREPVLLICSYDLSMGFPMGLDLFPIGFRAQHVIHALQATASPDPLSDNVLRNGHVVNPENSACTPIPLLSMDDT